MHQSMINKNNKNSSKMLKERKNSNVNFMLITYLKKKLQRCPIQECYLLEWL